MGKALMLSRYLAISLLSCLFLFCEAGFLFASEQQAPSQSNAHSVDMYLEHAEMKRTIKPKPIPSDFMYNLRLQLDEADKMLVKDIILYVQEGLLFNFSFSESAMSQKKTEGK